MQRIDEEREPTSPRIWVLVALFVVIELIGVLVVVSDWPKDKPTMSSDFVFRALIVPLFAYFVVYGVVVHAWYVAPLDRVRLWNLMCQWRTYHWVNWTRNHVALVDSVVLTPEPEIAESMLGLEGAAPVNAEKVLPLELELPAGASRVGYVLEKLLTPLLPAVTQFSRAGVFQIVLQTAQEQDLVDLQRVMRKLKLPEYLDTSWIGAGAAAPMDSLWGDGKPLSGARLVLACQLHDGEEEPAFTEMAVAVLLAAPNTLASAGRRIKPQASLCRAITAESDGVEPALEIMLGAEQVPPKRIKNFWFSRLDKRMRHAVTTAVKDASLNVSTQDIDRALGRPGHANGWLAQALAAQMVWHGQGAQLIASPCKAGVALNVVGPQPASAAYPTAMGPLPMSPIWAAGMASAMFFLFLLSVESRGAERLPMMPWWAYLLIWLLLVLLQVGIDLLHCRMVKEDFDARCF
ncbi:MAG: hypothetical protein JO067_04000 [Cupriavidus sp.]|nr:hypothetical protein [Cupriavidus sp.]